MRRRPLLAALGLAFLLAALARWISDRQEAAFDPPTASTPALVEAAPMCPWRHPEADRRVFFPDATRHERETHILTGARPELARRLGRAPTGEEHALHAYGIYHDRHRLGTVLTRRVDGEYGGIELVVAVGADHAVRGIRIQRLREPEPIAGALSSPRWLDAFTGKTSAATWKLGQDVPNVPGSARASAAAVVDGVRSLLILLETAEQHGIRKASGHHD